MLYDAFAWFLNVFYEFQNVLEAQQQQREEEEEEEKALEKTDNWE